MRACLYQWALAPIFCSTSLSLRSISNLRRLGMWYILHHSQAGPALATQVCWLATGSTTGGADGDDKNDDEADDDADDGRALAPFNSLAPSRAAPSSFAPFTPPPTRAVPRVSPDPAPPSAALARARARTSSFSTRTGHIAARALASRCTDASVVRDFLGRYLRRECGQCAGHNLNGRRTLQVSPHRAHNHVWQCAAQVCASLHASARFHGVLGHPRQSSALLHARLATVWRRIAA